MISRTPRSTHTNTLCPYTYALPICSPFDLTVQSLNLRENSFAAVGDILMGYGQIGSINGSNSFCTGCDLTFTFTYTVHSIIGNQVVFDRSEAHTSELQSLMRISYAVFCLL